MTGGVRAYSEEGAAGMAVLPRKVLLTITMDRAWMPMETPIAWTITRGVERSTEETVYSVWVGKTHGEDCHVLPWLHLADCASDLEAMRQGIEVIRQGMAELLPDGKE
jgi:hypothetical protein